MFKNTRANRSGSVPMLCPAPRGDTGPALAKPSARSTALRGVLYLAAALAATLAIGATTADAATLVVDKDGEQCGNAGYQSISAAVAAADPGDTVKVCPGLYAESVLVDKPDLKLTAEGRPTGDCYDPAPEPADPTRQAIVSAPHDRALDLRSDRITVTGFVVQGSQQGIGSDQNFSGYRVSHNLVQQNTLGAVFGGSGQRLSRLSHNCFRQNGSGPVGAGVFSAAANLGAELRNGRIDHNSFYANNFAIRLGGGDETRVDHNRSLADGVFIRPAFTQALEITHNRVGQGPGPGISFFRNPAFPQPNANTVVSHNVIENRGSHGIVAGPNTLTGSLISHNTLTGNTLDGINLQAGNTGNQVEQNRADRNGSDGIHAQGATGNAFLRNRMSGNAEHDAHDDNRPANQWAGNRCDTDLPDGTICSH